MGKGDRSVIPGFGLTMGVTITYVSLMVIIPLAGLFLKTATLSWGDLLAIVTAPRVVAAYRLSLGTAFFAALVNVVFGLLIAWVLVRYRFPGRRVVDALVDLPFALPTAVAGIALTAILSRNGWIGAILDRFGIQAAFNPLGITLALVFIGLPFVVRTVQPVLQDFPREAEEAAASLGAGRVQTFCRIILPGILPALLTGFSLAFSRALGEYGSVVFISGNMPMRTEIVPLLIMAKLEQFDYAGATAIAVVMMVAAFVMLLVVNLLQGWSRRRIGS